MISRVIKVFILEDRQAEAELTKRAILKFAPNALFTIASNEEDFLKKINWGSYDVMMADYNLPGYNGLEALLHVKEHYPQLPFIFVTGTLNNEQAAAEAILSGADGYVLKSNLKALEGTTVKVLADSVKKIEEAKEKQQRISRRKLLLNKVKTLLSDGEDFSAKQEVLQSVQELEGLL